MILISVGFPGSDGGIRCDQAEPTIRAGASLRSEVFTLTGNIESCLVPRSFKLQRFAQGASDTRPRACLGSMRDRALDPAPPRRNILPTSLTRRRRGRGLGGRSPL